jgi:tetratricopeptide (TPR) repeat protein
MFNKALTPFERRFEDWEAAHPRQWIATTDRTTVAKFISDQVDKIVSTQLEAADRIIVSQERIADGIDKIAFGVDRVADGLESLASAFEWGFSEMVWQMELQRAVLVEILRVLQAPLDTQAKELRKRAEDAYRNGWIDEALEDFLESEKKNRYDFTVHQSLGNIFLFHKKNPEKALEYYEKAAKYATPKSPYHASLALLHIGLTYYLQGDFQKAYEATLKAIGLTPNIYEAHYQHAQYCANLGKYDEAIEHLREAIRGDRYYCLKAGSEKDFDVMKERLRSFFEDLRDKAQNQAKSEIDKAEELVLDAESYGLSTLGEPGKATNKFRAAKKKLNEAKEFLRRASLFDCWDATYKAYVAQKMALDSSAECLSDQISKVRREREEKERKLEERKKLWTELVVLIPVGAGILFYIINIVILFIQGEIFRGIEALLCGGIGFVYAIILLVGCGILCLFAYIIELIYKLLIKKHRAHYENKLAKLQGSLSEVQTKRTQLGIEEETKYEDAEQYEDFLRKIYG